MPQPIVPQSPHEAWPEDWFEPAGNCPFCRSHSLQPCIDGVEDWYFGAVPGTFSYLRCLHCHSLVLSRRPKQERLVLAYSGYYTRVTPTLASGSMLYAFWRRIVRAYVQVRFGKSGDLIDRAFAGLVGALPRQRRELELRYRFIPSSNARLLDYGSGNGAFLQRAAALGCKAVGVEFDELVVRNSRAAGLDVYMPDEAIQRDWGQRFDHASANHVIEHVADPVVLLKQLRKWLKPDGVLFLELPNAQAKGLGVFGRFWRGLEAPRHLAIPSLQGLRIALDHAGFGEPQLIDRPDMYRRMQAEAVAASRGQTPTTGLAVSASEFSGPELLTMLVRPRG